MRFGTEQEALLGRMDALLMSVDRVIATAITNADRPNVREVRALLASYRDHLARAIADGDIDEQLTAIAGMSGVNKGLSDTYWASELLDVRQLGFDLSNAANEAGASLRREHDREAL